MAFSMAATLFLAFGPRGFFDPLDVDGGYSVIWLAVMYVAGASLRRFGIPRLPVAGWVGAFLVSTLVVFAARAVPCPQGMLQKLCDALTNYASPFVLLQALSLFSLSVRAELPAPVAAFLHKAVPSVFGVYLIHWHPVLKRHVFGGALVGIAGLGGVGCAIGAILVSLAVFSASLVLSAAMGAVLRRFNVRSLVECCASWLEA